MSMWVIIVMMKSVEVRVLECRFIGERFACKKNIGRGMGKSVWR